MADDEERLKPARPDVDLGEKPAYMPRIPWRYVVLAVVGVGFLVGMYQYRQASKAAEIRTRIQRGYEGQLGPFAERYRTFRDKLEGWVMEVADNDPPERYADPRLRISALHRGQGLYLRLSREQARTKEGIAIAAKDLLRDGIDRCLGIAPTSVRGFYEKGEFLMPGWIDEVETAEVARLEVLEEDLKLRADRDLPQLASAMQAQYFLVVVQATQSRRDGPSDVYLWDLREDRLLLSVRTEPVGRLVPIRIALPGVETPRAPSVDLSDSILAQDCAIAAQVKEVAGEPAMDFASPVPSEGEGAAPGEGGGEAGAAEGTTPTPAEAPAPEAPAPEAAEAAE
jgi:hypothetical protein